MAESDQPVLALWPRYTDRPLPAYRFIPGRTPHPRRHPQGHSFEQPDPLLRPFEPEHWKTSEDYLWGIDLYNWTYWWEAHEVFEAFWHAYGRHTPAGNFFQALIQCAAANLKRELGHEQATRNLVSRALARLQKCPVHYMGLDTEIIAEQFTQWLNQREPHGHVLFALSKAGGKTRNS
ncbi:MAG TPA: DUF309 domain-containing protein [Nitrospira sp.]|nr:DUF309 domain-containing protein [Nitrospira sp.]